MQINNNSTVQFQLNKNNKNFFFSTYIITKIASQLFPLHLTSRQLIFKSNKTKDHYVVCNLPTDGGTLHLLLTEM